MITLEKLEKYLWDSAVILRGLIDAASYKEYIFPLVFFKRISDVQDEEYLQHFQEAVDMGSDEADAHEYAQGQMENSSIQIPDGAHWNDVFNITEDLGQKLKEAFNAIERANPAKKIDGRFVGGLEGVFGDKNIWTNKTKMPDATIRALLNHYNSLTLNLAECPADEMGTGYEYLIGQFADDAGHTAQEFYTNRTVVELMAEILQLQPGESIYDPTCGSGGMLIKSLTYLKDKGQEWRDVKVYGQELNADTSAIARMNCYLHGVNEFSIVNADTLENPAFIKNGKVQQFDVVLANPPYSISAWNREMFAHDKYGRCFLGVPPQRFADYAFVQHIIASMSNDTGRSATLLPHGVLTRTGEESQIRQKLVENDLVDCVISIGKNLFFNSAMEACILICRTNKEETKKGKVLFIRATDLVVRNGNESWLSQEHIAKISNLYWNYTDEIDYATTATLDDIKENDFSIQPGRYVKRSSASCDCDDISALCVNWEESSNLAKIEIENLSKLINQ